MKGVLSRLFVSAWLFCLQNMATLAFSFSMVFAVFPVWPQVAQFRSLVARTRKHKLQTLSCMFQGERSHCLWQSLLSDSEIIIFIVVSRYLKPFVIVFFQKLQLLQLVGDKVAECGSVAAAAWVLAWQQQATDETLEDEKPPSSKARSMRAVVRTSIGFSNSAGWMESLKNGSTKSIPHHLATYQVFASTCLLALRVRSPMVVRSSDFSRITVAAVSRSAQTRCKIYPCPRELSLQNLSLLSDAQNTSHSLWFAMCLTGKPWFYWRWKTHHSIP